MRVPLGFLWEMLGREWGNNIIPSGSRQSNLPGGRREDREAYPARGREKYTQQDIDRESGYYHAS